MHNDQEGRQQWRFFFWLHITTPRDGKTTGVEVLIYNDASTAKETAKKVCESIAQLGYKNRGVKSRSDLYYLWKTDATAMLIECFFVDDKDDVQLYNYKSMASAIVYGITGKQAHGLLYQTF